MMTQQRKQSACFFLSKGSLILPYKSFITLLLQFSVFFKRNCEYENKNIVQNLVNNKTF